MADIKDIIQNVQQIYDSNNSLNILKDFERVIDELDVYVYDNWIDGELVEGPKDTRYFISCTFMWPKAHMPDPKGGMKLINYGCKVEWAEDYVAKVRQIKKPEDIRPGTKKGKIDYYPVWMVKITMPKKLIATVETGYTELDRNKIEDIVNQVPVKAPIQQPELEAADADTEENDLGL